jgi:hypothetical protein
MSFDATNNLKTVGGWNLAAGNNVLYTCPPNTTAFPIRFNNDGIPPFSTANIGAVLTITNNDTLSINYTDSVGGTAWNTPFTVAAAATTSLPIPTILTAGQQIVINLSAANTGSSAYYMPIWERSN